MNVQVTIDCAEPHRLAAFYGAAGIGYQVEDHTETVDRALVAGVIDADDVVEVGDQRGFVDSAACVAAEGPFPRLHFQRVAEPKAAKNRVHLDFQFPTDLLARNAVVDRMLAAGAHRVGGGSQEPSHQWVTLADPEGNELCVSN